MTEIAPQPGIMEISPYVGGVSHVAGVANVVKLSSNENPFGPSPAAIDAVKGTAAGLHRYPSTDHGPLRMAISACHGLDADRIVMGVGSDEIIALLCQAYVGPGDEAIHTEHGFALYKINTLASGGTPVEVAERERVTDVDAILAACSERTKLVFIANPNNPTGTMIGQAEVHRLAGGLPPQAMLVLDGAYADYVDGFDGGAGLVDARDNVVMTRTFSKIYGLGGLRVGWGYGPAHAVDALNRIRGPFNMSVTALAAAEAAVEDQAYVDNCRCENAKWRAWLAEALAEIGVVSDTSCGNFILARFADRDEAESCDRALQRAGVIVRRVAGYNLPNALRITIGDEDACRRVAEAVRAFKAGRG